MCLATPRRVVRVDGGRAEVDWDRDQLWVSAADALDLRPGELVLVHAGLVLDRVAPDEVEQILTLHASLELASPDAEAVEAAG